MSNGLPANVRIIRSGIHPRVLPVLVLALSVIHAGTQAVGVESVNAEKGGPSPAELKRTESATFAVG